MMTDLRLQHFRSYKDDSFEFDPGVNIIVGPNASGKTNLLEAILVCCTGGSYRGKDQELVAFRAQWARLDAHTEQQTRIVKLRLENERTTKQFEIDEHTLTRLPLARTLPVVLFDPNHLQLLHGPPELRRAFLDDLLEQTITGYGSLRRQYRRALSQRNHLLKRGSVATDQLFVWNIRLSELGGRLAEERLKLIERFNKTIAKRYSQLANKRHQVVLSYESSCDPAHYSSQLLKRLEHNTEQDIARGFTGHGPHRDDLGVLLGGKPADSTASRGETRTLLLALKLLELEIVEASRDQSAILLLDDVFSELDGARRRALTETLQDHQSFITTTDADVVVQHFMGNCHIIPTIKN
jgi:DNA replication and repair protein RecF